MADKAHNCFHAVIKGRVQGVGYRMFAREAAVRLGCTGWVRNRPDGNVEVHAEGSESVLTELLTELSSGPAWSHVSDIDVTWKLVDKDTMSDRFRIAK